MTERFADTVAADQARATHAHHVADVSKKAPHPDAGKETP